MKFYWSKLEELHYPSHPTRGAWIEIFVEIDVIRIPQSRTPHGVRGLKYRSLPGGPPVDASHPTRGAWIEIHPLLAP